MENEVEVAETNVSAFLVLKGRQQDIRGKWCR